MSNYTDVAAGVTEGLVEAGEDLTINRIVTTTDPNNPTQPPETTTLVYTCRGYVGPDSRYNPASMQREVTTDCIIDPLSIRNAEGALVNTTTALSVVTAEGDVVIDASGKEWRLTGSEHPRIEGKLAAFIHRGLA